MCTTLMITTKPNDKTATAVVSGRTMEFGFDLESKVMVVPRKTKITPTLPNGKDPHLTIPGTPYETLYGMVGANALDMDVIVDGINEHGLYFSALYFPGYAQYADGSDHPNDILLAPHDLGNWVLGRYKSVADVKASIAGVALVATEVPTLKMAPPLHFIVRDRTGASIVIEPIGGALKIYDNPVGVMTNSPPFDWHMTNLINYRGLQTENIASVVLGGGHELPQFGQGSGMIGLPGDATPPSRFVRAVVYSQTAVPAATGHEAILQMFHIMNTFDIPVGSVTETHVEDGETTVHRDYTSWTTAVDLSHGRFYFRTYNDQTIRMIDVENSLIKAENKIRYIEMDSQQAIVDTTMKFLPLA